MPTWPQAVIPPFAAGYAPQPPQMQAWIQQPLGFCSQMPLFRSIQQGSQALSSASSLNVLAVGGTAGDVLEDPYGGWSHVATSAQPANSYLVPFTGWYEVTLTLLTLAAAIWLTSAVQVSGGTIQQMGNLLTPASAPGGCTASLYVPATGGIDYLQAGALVSANATTDTTGGAGQFPALEIAYVSSG